MGGNHQKQGDNTIAQSPSIHYLYYWLGTNRRRPLAGAPISVTSDIRHTVPLYCS